MPALPSDIENNLLILIWQASLVLVTASLSVLIILFVRRLVQTKQIKQRATRRRELEYIVWALLETHAISSEEALKQLKKGDAAIICGIALDILRPLKGEDERVIVRLLEQCRLQGEIRKMLAKGSRGQRIRMLTLLGHFMDPETLGLLKDWTGNRDVYIQLAALRSLAKRGAVEALPQVLKHLYRTKNHNPLMLADVLERFGEPAVQFLGPLAASAEDLDIRLAAISALGAIASLDAVPFILALSTDPLGEIRAPAIAALARLSDTRAIPSVMSGLSDTDSAVRIQAAQAAGAFQLEGAIPALLPLLEDANWWVRYRAAEALFRLGTAGQHLLEAVRRHATPAGVIAGQVLAEMAVAP